MLRSRLSHISLIDTPYCCCVRCLFLCGVDGYSGQSYEHRRAWVEDSLLFFYVFAIDVCAYGVMSNHRHGVVHVDKDSALS
jgi:hypothetical protein